MRSLHQLTVRFWLIAARRQLATNAILVIGLICFGMLSHAQSFTVLHTLNGGADGNQLINGLTIDRQGNLYGTAFEGGINNCGDDYGCGTVFKLSRHGTQWIFSILYRFTGRSDGWAPAAPVTVAADGSIYGTTSLGGTTDCSGLGCGTVFRLQPPPRICGAFNCPWRKTTLYQFTFGLDGAYPKGPLILDQAGNIYGTATNSDSQRHKGSVWELSPSGSGWTFNVIHEFADSDGAGWPNGGLIFDRSGKLWGVGGFGGAQDCGDPQLPNWCGSIFELTPSGSGWTENTAFGFRRSNGDSPTGSLALDQSGKLYGTLENNGPNGNGGVFQYNPSTQQLNVLFSGVANGEDWYGPAGGVVLDPVGNVYAADPYTGAHSFGFALELTPSSGSWILSDLHDFTGGSDGGHPYGPMVMDANGNIYGANQSNVIFEITP